MVDDNSSDFMRSSPTFSCPTEWVRFDDSVKDKITFDAITEEKRSEENGRYLSRLEKELHRLQEKKRKQVTSRDMIKTLQEAKDSQMKELMDKTEIQEIFMTDDSDLSGSSCCFPLYRVMFPKQPLNNEELECLVDNDNDDGS